MPGRFRIQRYLLALFMLGHPVVTSCASDDKPSPGTGGNGGETSQGAEAGDATVSGSSGDSGRGGSEASAGDGGRGGSGASAGAPPSGIGGTPEGVGGSGSPMLPPLEPAWPEFRFRCQGLALLGDSLVVVQDEQRGQEQYRMVRLVELSTGHFRDGVGVDEPVELQGGARDSLHVAALGNTIVVAGQHRGTDDRSAYQLWVLDSETLEIQTRMSVERGAHPDQVVLDAEYVYVAEDNATVRRFGLPDLEEELTIGRRDSGITYATRVALDGDRLFYSGSGLGQAQVVRTLLDGGSSPGWGPGSQYVFQNRGDRFPWSMLVTGDSLYVAGIAAQGRAELMRFSTDDGTVLVDHVMDGPFGGNGVRIAVNSSAFFYDRRHSELGDELVRASLDDFQDLAVGKGPPNALGLVADEEFVYVCSDIGLHRFDANTLELAGP